MQNRYVCDLSDFAKYGLLRRLIRPDPRTDNADFKLSVVWYFHPDERHGPDGNRVNRDGRNTAYLHPTAENRLHYGNCDLPLWNKLRCLLTEEKRCLHCVERSGILPPSTKFFGTMLHFPAHMTTDTRRATRQEWINAALTRVRDTDIVYLDPDTGIGPDEKKFLKPGLKYAYLSDIQEFWCKGKSIVVYQHLGHANANDQIRAKKAALRQFTEPIALKYGARVFFILPQPCHRPRIEARVRRMAADRLGWGRHFREA